MEKLGKGSGEHQHPHQRWLLLPRLLLPFVALQLPWVDQLRPGHHPQPALLPRFQYLLAPEHQPPCCKLAVPHALSRYLLQQRQQQLPMLGEHLGMFGSAAGHPVCPVLPVLTALPREPALP